MKTRLKGYRTVIFNSLAAIPVMLEATMQVLSLPEFAGVMPDHWLPWYALFLVLANLILRRATTTPIGKDE